MMTLHKHTPRVIVSAIVVLLTATMATSAEPAPDNAALLYYQACLLYGPPDAALEQEFTDFRNGRIPSTEAVRKHIAANRPVIELVVKAADLPHCDWGYDYSQGLDLTLTHLSAIKRIAFLIVADARLFAEQGDYRTALDRCMTIHKMALHETDRTVITYLVGVSLSALANKTIQDLLPGVSSETQTLRQLRTQLSQIRDAFPPMQYAVTQEGQVLAFSIRKEKAEDTVRDLALDEKDSGLGSASAKILAGDEAFFERNRAHWLDAIGALVAILDLKLPYTETYAKLSRHCTQAAEEWKDNPDATFTGLLLPAISRVFALTTRMQAHFNALRTATDLYAIRARTGRLPSVLPTDAPFDPFSGKPFAYEIANDHFTLGCREKEDSKKTEADRYEFKLRR